MHFLVRCNTHPDLREGIIVSSRQPLDQTHEFAGL
jgi:hypothetical protein